MESAVRMIERLADVYGGYPDAVLWVMGGFSSTGMLVRRLLNQFPDIYSYLSADAIDFISRLLGY